MSNYGPRKPLHWQEGGMEKAIPKNESYESFRPNMIHPPNYEMMKDRANDGMSVAARIRRYPNGELDFNWTLNHIVQAIHSAESHGFLYPLEMAMLTVVFPTKYRFVEPQEAEIRTQLSKTEKDTLRALVAKQLGDEANWSAGIGGGNARPRHKGIP